MFLQRALDRSQIQLVLYPFKREQVGNCCGLVRLVRALEVVSQRHNQQALPCRLVEPLYWGITNAGLEAVECPLLCRNEACLLYTSPSPRDKRQSRMPSSA